MTISNRDLTGEDHWVCYPGEVAFEVARAQKIIEEQLARMVARRLITLFP